MGRKYFLWGMIIMAQDHNFATVLDQFDWNRDVAGIKSQLQDNQFFGESLEQYKDFDALNKQLNTSNADEFLSKLSEDEKSPKKPYYRNTYNNKKPQETKEQIRGRFNQFINIVKGIESPYNSSALLPDFLDENDQDKNNSSNNFFSVNNIKEIFLDFGTNREKIDSSSDKNKDSLTDDDKVNLVNDVLSDCYKMLAIFYFGGVLSAKNLNSHLKDLESIKNDLNENIIMPGRWETFCYAVKRFFQSLFSDTKRVSPKEVANEIQNIKKAKSVFDKLKQTADCMHKDNEK